MIAVEWTGRTKNRGSAAVIEGMKCNGFLLALSMVGVTSPDYNS